MSRRREFGGNVLGGIVGGLIGNAIAHADDDHKPAATTPKPVVAAKPVVPVLEEVLKRVTQVPVGGTVFLKVEEYRILQDKNLIQYKETIPYCMERIIEV